LLEQRFVSENPKSKLNFFIMTDEIAIKEKIGMALSNVLEEPQNML
jgi:hypothetical protein